jgi:XTP/dITP diphosphohydrolase
MKLVVATRNPHKLAEIRRMLDVPGLELVGADDVPGLPDVEEDGATFAENAVKKAVTLAAAAGCPALADDSGLEVDALGGAPGVLSARYAGEGQNDGANNRKLLAALDGVNDRTARFRCVIALADADGTCETVSGACEGRIVDAPRGTEGFGYDPLFLPAGHDLTFGEMGAELKDRISHRAAALAAARDAWESRFRPGSGTRSRLS